MDTGYLSKIAALQRLVAADQTRGTAWRALGQALRGNDAAAILAWTQAVRIDPGDGLAWCGLARAQEHSGLIEDALDSYGTAVRLRPDDGALRLRMAMAMPVIMASREQILDRRAAMAAALWSRVPSLRWAWVTLAGLVALGLYGCDYHFVGDMLAGTFLGIASAKGVLALLFRK